MVPAQLAESVATLEREYKEGGSAKHLFSGRATWKSHTFHIENGRLHFAESSLQRSLPLRGGQVSLPGRARNRPNVFKLTLPPPHLAGSPDKV